LGEHASRSLIAGWRRAPTHVIFGFSSLAAKGIVMAELFEAPRFIAIEGPLRVGKSTLAGILAETLHARRIVEPENNPFLGRFYQELSGAALATQMWFLVERYEQMRQAAKELEDAAASELSPVVADYLFEKDKLFAYINLTDAELDLYNRYYQIFRSEVPTPDLVVYLQASPEVLKQRLRRKGVSQEQAISDAYIEQLTKAYEHFFFHYTASDLLVVDTSKIDFVNREQDLALLLKRLSEPIRGKQYFLPLETQEIGPSS
jgi:deoxyadenosine/deoxycytidine kinase